MNAELGKDIHKHTGEIFPRFAGQIARNKPRVFEAFLKNEWTP